MPAAGGAADRYKQTYPELTAREIDRLRRFGAIKHYAEGDRLFETGKITCGMFVVLKGHVAFRSATASAMSRRWWSRGRANSSPRSASCPAQAALVDGYAEDDVEVLADPAGEPAPPADRRSRARRAHHARADPAPRQPDPERQRRRRADRRADSPRPDPPARLPRPQRLSPPPARSGERSGGRASSIARYAPSPADLPLVICADGTVLRNPSEDELARALGMIDGADDRQLYDVAVVGGGPAGLATAVYAGSEGLSVVVLD